MSDTYDKPTWLEIEDARAHVASLLDSSGVTLEARIAQRCRALDASNSSESFAVSAERLVWGQPSDQAPPREIDQIVSLYEEVQLTATLGIQLVVNVLIEAKTRRGMTVFGVAADDAEVSEGALPTLGDLKRTRLYHKEVAPLLPSYLANQQIRQLATLEFEGQTAKRIMDEQLTYKAAASLYDFVRANAAIDRDPALRGVPSQNIRDLVVQFNEAREYGSRLVHPDKWLRKNAVSVRDQMLARNQLVHHAIEIFVPLVCVDAALYEVDLDDDGAVSGYTTAEALTTSVRLPGMFGSLSDLFPKRGGGAVVTVVPLTGLPSVLASIVEYFKAIRSALTAGEKADKDWAALESAFWYARAEGVGLTAEPIYRSDYGGTYP